MLRHGQSASPNAAVPGADPPAEPLRVLCTSMSDAVERFCAAADAIGFTPQPTVYPQGTRTAVDAAAAIGCDVAQIVKSLIFDGDGAPLLVLTSGANRVDTAKVELAAGISPVGKADAAVVREATGFAIGGTPPFGHPAPVRTLIDEDLLDHDTVWAAAGTPSACFPIAPAQLVELSGATVADIAERQL